jgi:hypothetical protein
MQDRLRLEVEDRRILAEIRDLDDATAPCSIVDQERLVALTTQVDGGARDAEELGSNLRHLIRRKARRRRLEHVHRLHRKGRNDPASPSPPVNRLAR